MKKPEVIEYLRNGAFFVNCTGKPFSTVAVDMALKQTILKGIMAFSDIDSAVNRWQVTTSMKTQITKTF